MRLPRRTHLSRPFAAESTPFSSRLRRPRYADVAATLALALTIGYGGAHAAALVTGDQIAKDAIGSKQLKDGSVRSADLNKSLQTRLAAATGAGVPGAAGTPGGPGGLGGLGGTGPTGGKGETGAPGAPGLAGAAGAPGPRGFSAWEPIPAGTTVTGEEYVRLFGTSPVTSHLPGVASNPLADSLVNFAVDASVITTDDDITCLGSYAAPTAPPGHVCIYVGSVSSATNATGYVFADPAVRRQSFYVAFTAAAPAYVFYSWAYTAD